jgi:hypothetical protein
VGADVNPLDLARERVFGRFQDIGLDAGCRWFGSMAGRAKTLGSPTWKRT